MDFSGLSVTGGLTFTQTVPGTMAAPTPTLNSTITQQQLKNILTGTTYALTNTTVVTTPVNFATTSFSTSTTGEDITIAHTLPMTIEAWVYIPSGASISSIPIFTTVAAPSPTFTPTVIIYADCGYYYMNSAGYGTSSNNFMAPNYDAWNHYTAYITTTTWKVWVNGTLKTGGTYPTTPQDYTQTATRTLVRLAQNLKYNEYRIASGDVYGSANSTITVPTQRLTGISGTTALLTGTVTNNSVNVAFTAPGDTGGAAITSYTVTATPGSSTQSSTTSPVLFNALSGGTYTFTAKATNSIGTGNDSSSSNPVVFSNVPGAPAITQVSQLTKTSIRVTYTAPASDGGSAITSYTAVSSADNGVATISTALGGLIDVTGLTAGSTYTFKVYATNSVGSSALSTASASILAAAVPGAPTIGTATSASATSVTVTYTAPADNGGSAITSYTAVSSPGNITGTLSQAGSGTITVSGLTTGTAYTFTVYATNVVGNSASSSASNSATPTSPAVAWAVSSTDPIISWPSTTNASLQIFAIPSNGGDTNPWQYAPSPWTTWSSFGGTPNTYVAVTGGITWKGTTYTGYVRSSQWTTGNPTYKQRYISTTLAATYLTDEVTAKNNKAFTGTLTG